MQQLGRYELKEKIGEGAMSEVYKAYDPALQRTLAIKVLKPELAQDKERLSYFLNEVTISGKLSHPNIVQIFDVGEVDDAPFIVMELVDAQSLDEWMRHQSDLPLETMIDIVEQLAAALEYAHAKGIVHRDLKPSNVLIESSGRVRLMDFGVAYLHEPTQESDHGHDEETIVGTPYYMSPEQLAGKTPDQRSDLYSLGVVMYQLVFGNLPFEASTIRDLVALIQASDVNLSTSRCPHAVKKVIRRLLHKKASFRYSNATELRQQLSALELELSHSSNRWSERITATWLYTAVVAGVFSIVLLGFLMFTLNDLSKNLSGVLSDYGSMLVQQTKDQVDEALLLGDDLALNAMTEQVAKNDQIEYLYITDHSGVVKATTASTGVGATYQTPPALEPLGLHQGSRVGQITPAGEGDRIYHFNSPITFNGKQIGSVIIGLSAHSIDDVWWRTTTVLGLFIVFACLSIPALVYVICRFFTNEFKQLGKALQGLYVGNYFTRLPVSKIDEVGYAKRQFNELAEQMEAFIKESDPDIERTQLSDSTIETNENQTVVIRKTEDVT
ncbi:serine/threonine protein kinase [Marinomonas ostreistagni]|uniref:Serine/threonine protein kinase n=1 Tax=Marinomonas ostreistagni TaxID=359209 RepID=A0ABS0Z7Y5_9GAMM|nr:serine/threonine-protein kinase [Marinomonas ostreistagni]MBJ7549776.1 serine/threonine protein kinase [Marinomonas ostreistagni]